MSQPTTGGTNAYILLVDSDPQSLVFLSMIIERLNCRSRSALGVGNALEIANADLPSLVITELFLKGLSGLDLLERLGKKPRTQAAPVVIMTRELTPELERQCRAAGAFSCLEKPCQVQALYEIVQRVTAPGSRRKSVRIQTRLSVMVNGLPLDCVEGECATNLSVTGMQLRTAKSYPVDSKVHLQVMLHGQEVEAEARVVYCQAPDNGMSGMWGIGLQFLRTSPETGEIVRQFINDEAVHGIEPGSGTAGEGG